MQEIIPYETRVWTNLVPTKLNSEESDRVAIIADRINENWRKSLDGIFYVGVDCATARNDFGPQEKERLYKSLPFKASMFSKLAAIGEDARLKRHKELLPTSISTLYEISNLSDDLFDAAIAEGVLEPDLKREQLANWVNSRKDKPVTGKKDKPTRKKLATFQPPPRLYCLYAAESLTAERHLEVEEALNKMAKQQGLKAVTFPGENLLAELKETFKRPRAT